MWIIFSFLWDIYLWLKWLGHGCPEPALHAFCIVTNSSSCHPLHALPSLHSSYVIQCLSKLPSQWLIVTGNYREVGLLERMNKTGNLCVSCHVRITCAYMWCKMWVFSNRGVWLKYSWLLFFGIVQWVNFSTFPFSFAGVRPASWFEGSSHLLLVPSLHCSEVFPRQISCISKPGCNICFLEDLKLYMGNIKSLCLNPSQVARLIVVLSYIFLETYECQLLHILPTLSIINLSFIHSSSM